MSVHCANASYFNPLPRKEGDRTGYRWLGDEVKGFQSTPS